MKKYHVLFLSGEYCGIQPAWLKCHCQCSSGLKPDKFDNLDDAMAHVFENRAQYPFTKWRIEMVGVAK